ncbi:MAG TPA: universal stress protein [Gemmatimonadales bacterium]|jgi:nucleotide-binding universal stress UspA family protein|nr:universal stress protein [Gemmatimonadales bacterium]
MFTRLLVGLDGSPNADEALEQAVHLGLRFKSGVVVAHVQESHFRTNRTSDSGALLQRARERVADAGLAVDTVLKHGHPDAELAALAADVDTVLVGRRGRSSRADVIGRTAASLIRIAERTVIVCGSKPSPMSTCAIAYDGRATAQRALELVVRFASVVQSTVHIIHATIDTAMGTMVVGEAEAVLSLEGVAFVTHLEHGTPGEAVARVIERTKCDALFAGAHVGEGQAVTVSHAEEILLHTDIPVVIQP